MLSLEFSLLGIFSVRKAEFTLDWLAGLQAHQLLVNRAIAQKVSLPCLLWLFRNDVFFQKSLAMMILCSFFVRLGIGIVDERSEALPFLNNIQQNMFEAVGRVGGMGAENGSRRMTTNPSLLCFFPDRPAKWEREREVIFSFICFGTFCFSPAAVGAG